MDTVQQDAAKERPPACDTHVHLLEPERFPFAETATYQPVPGERGDVEALRRVLATHGLTHALLVNPIAGYGFDNRCMIDALERYPTQFRGIAIVPPNVADAALDRLAEAGVVGARLDLIQMGARFAAEAIESGLFRRLAARNWFAQIQAEKNQLAEVAAALERSGTRLLVDHAGRPDPTLGVDQPGFRALLALGRSGRAVVKLSGPFRFSLARYPYADADPFMRALVEAFTPERCVWASDWSFFRAPARLDYGPVLALLERWVPDARERRRILWDTPARLFGFSFAGSD